MRNIYAAVGLAIGLGGCAEADDGGDEWVGGDGGPALETQAKCLPPDCADPWPVPPAAPPPEVR